MRGALVPQGDWRWYGTAGHFICASWCRFHLLTRVGDFIVSTVGEYVPPEGVMRLNAQIRGTPLMQRGDALEAEYLEKFGYEELGAWGTYETLVFSYGSACDEEECKGCGMPRPSSWSELDGVRYDNAKAATEGHYAFCHKASRGEISQVEVSQ